MLLVSHGIFHRRRRKIMVLILLKAGLELVRSPSRRRWCHLFWRPQPKRDQHHFKGRAR